MPGLSLDLYRRCLKTLLYCDQLADDRALQGVFVVEGLAHLRDALPQAENRKARASAVLDYVLRQRDARGDPALLLFLTALRDYYPSAHAQHKTLDALAQEVATAVARDPTPGPPIDPAARGAAQTSDPRGPGEALSNTNGPVSTGEGDVIDLRGSQGAVIKPTGPVTQHFGSPPVSPVSTLVDTAALRARLQRLDDVQIDTLCIDHFPDVYDTFGRGMRRDEKINLLLDHCRRNPADAARLAGLA